MRDSKGHEPSDYINTDVSNSIAPIFVMEDLIITTRGKVEALEKENEMLKEQVNSLTNEKNKWFSAFEYLWKIFGAHITSGDASNYAYINTYSSIIPIWKDEEKEGKLLEECVSLLAEKSENE